MEITLFSAELSGRPSHPWLAAYVKRNNSFRSERLMATFAEMLSFMIITTLLGKAEH